jgi:hypothetical protein
MCSFQIYRAIYILRKKKWDWDIFMFLHHKMYKNCTEGTSSLKCPTWQAQTFTSWFEFITNLMHNLMYSIIILHHDPQHVLGIAVLIFRRTIVYWQYLVSSHLTLYAVIQSVTIPDTVNIQFSSWRWAQRCSKHVEDHDVILLLNKQNCALSWW